jgi:SAM-dependent methyltransferase
VWPGADNLAMFARYIALLGEVEDDTTECFRAGGGVPCSRFPPFHTVMAEESALTVISGLESHILPLVPGLPGRLAAGIGTLDVGCGQGRVITHLAELFPNSQFVGLDLSDEALTYGRALAAQRGLSNLDFVTRDRSDFDATAPVEAFDFITTFEAVHDQSLPLNVLKGINLALKADGVDLMQNNIDHPIGALIYTCHTCIA